LASAQAHAVAASSEATKAAAAASTAASAASVASAAAASAVSAAVSANAAVAAEAAADEKHAKQVPGLAVPPQTVSGLAWFWFWLSTTWPQTASLLSGITFALVVKTMCMVGNVIVQISPYPQVKRWESRGCTGEADAAPYISIAFGGWQWCFYGMFAWMLTKRSGFLILVHSNCLGALLGSYYALAFFRNCRNANSIMSFQRYVSAIMSLVVLQFCTICVLPAERALFLTGLISSFCSFVGAMSMLVTVPTVLRLKDSRSIPGPLVCANFMSASVWCVCGWMLQDLLVSGPNVVSTLSSATCIYLKYKYPSTEDEKEEDNESQKSKEMLVTSQKARNKQDMCDVVTSTSDYIPLKLKASLKKTLFAAAAIKEKEEGLSHKGLACDRFEGEPKEAEGGAHLRLRAGDGTGGTF
jgi:uncharacterized protein with PQ loop repeat